MIAPRPPDRAKHSPGVALQLAVKAGLQGPSRAFLWRGRKTGGRSGKDILTY